jgi:ankyrin repeat protein
MSHELLRAAATGDKALLEQVLGLSCDSGGKLEAGISRRCLKGVTSEGNTALHTAAGRGYTELVRIMCGVDASLIRARNNLRNTPLISASRAGHVDVVCYLIDRALDPATAAAVLEAGASGDEESVLRARNAEGTTAMHEAIRNGHEAVLEKLVSADGGLAAVVDGKGFSPLYLAAALGRTDMVAVLIGGSPPDDGVKSPAYYVGPHGQTALHAAVLVSEGTSKLRIFFVGMFCTSATVPDVMHATGTFQEMTKSLWCWEPTLAKKVDNSGNTALHHAASAGKIGAVKLLLQKDSSLAYIPDVDGLFPAHTAAKMGKIDVIELLMETCPNSDELLDNRGRNVLHCAIEHRKEKVVQHMCRNPRFGRMVNARDGAGNTPLHLAVKHGCDGMAMLLTQDVKVNLSVMNNDGATPLDVAINELDHGYTYPMNPEVLIAQCLVWCGAHRSPRRRDEYLDKRAGAGGSDRELRKYTNLTQNRAIGSVLIATVTFAAPFTVPGATADAAERPAFRAFVLCNALAFMCSTVATCLLMYAGLTTVHPRYRSRYHVWSSNLLHVGVLLVIATFAFGVHLTLSPPGAAGVPVGNLNAAVCAMACVSVVFAHPGTTWWPVVLARPIWARLGLKGLLGVLLGPRPIPCQKLLLSRTPWLNLFKMLATLLILALILVTFLWDVAYLRSPAIHHHCLSSTLLLQSQCQVYSFPT